MEAAASPEDQEEAESDRQHHPQDTVYIEEIHTSYRISAAEITRITRISTLLENYTRSNAFLRGIALNYMR